MALIIPTAGQVTVSGNLASGERWSNVMHVEIGTGTLTAGDADDIMDIFAAYYTACVGRRHNTWNVSELRVRDIRSDGGETFTRNVTTINGTSGSSPHPTQIAMVVTLRTPTNNRRGRGRVYLSGLVNSAMGSATGQWQTTALNAEADDFEDLCQALDTNVTSLAVASRVAVQLYKVTRITIDSVLDTQRRRVRDMVPITIVTRNP